MYDYILPGFGLIIISPLIGIAILYFTVKAAVKNAVRELKREEML